MHRVRFGRLRARRACAFLLAVGGPTACAERSADGVWSLDAARIVYETRTEAGTVLSLLDRARGEATPLTSAGERNWGGRVSPDGGRLAFVSLRDGDYELYVREMTGAGARNVTDDPDYDVVGAWAPDGGRLAFMSTRGYELGSDDGPFPGHVYVTDLESGHLRRVTTSPLTSSLGPSDWSPDGRWLLMARDFGGQIDVVLLDADTGEERRLTDDPANEYGASFSHDGDWIAFHADDGARSTITVMRVDGTGRRSITRGDQVDYGPRWSPDDAWLLATRRGEGETEQYDVIALRVTDGETVTLVATPADERAGDWMPARPGA